MRAEGAASTPGWHCAGRGVLSESGLLGGEIRGLTWPPEKPTATTPSSLPLARNLGWIVDGEVMVLETGYLVCERDPLDIVSLLDGRDWKQNRMEMVIMYLN